MLCHTNNRTGTMIYNTRSFFVCLEQRERRERALSGGDTIRDVHSNLILRYIIPIITPHER
jgi:hypothetical protein